MARLIEENPVCNDTRECFARDHEGKCKILSSTYETDGKCPFCKSIEEYEKGKPEAKRRRRPSTEGHPDIIPA